MGVKRLRRSAIARFFDSCSVAVHVLVAAPLSASKLDRLTLCPMRARHTAHLTHTFQHTCTVNSRALKVGRGATACQPDDKRSRGCPGLRQLNPYKYKEARAHLSHGEMAHNYSKSTRSTQNYAYYGYVQSVHQHHDSTSNDDGGQDGARLPL